MLFCCGLIRRCRSSSETWVIDASDIDFVRENSCSKAARNCLASIIATPQFRESDGRRAGGAFDSSGKPDPFKRVGNDQRPTNKTEEGADKPHPLLASDFLPAGLHSLRGTLLRPHFSPRHFQTSGPLQIPKGSPNGSRSQR